MHQQHIDNTEAAISAWATVPPETVMRRLKAYRVGWRDGNAPSCGSPACFGGWLPYFGWFAALGVIATATGAPAFAGRLIRASDVSNELFGCCLLFEPRTRLDDEQATDHEVVMTRLLDHLDSLKR